MAETAELSPAQAAGALMGIVQSFWLSRAVHAAAELGLADHIAAGATSAQTLSTATKIPANALARLLRALVSEGFFTEENGTYSNSAKSELMRSDVPQTMRSVMRAELGQEHYGAWEELLYSLETGKTAMPKKYGMSTWEYYAKHPKHGQVFNEAMTGLTGAIEQAVFAVYDFSPFTNIIDIGGGHGRLLSGMLTRNTKAKGTLFDAPEVIAKASQLGAVGPRVTLVGGDFFKAVPAGGDLYTLKFIIHDWADEQALAILKNIRAAIAPQGKVVLLETVIPAGNEPAFSKFMDLNMLVMNGSPERTRAEYEKLLADAGLKLVRVIPTESVISVIEAVPA